MLKYFWLLLTFIPQLSLIHTLYMLISIIHFKWLDKGNLKLFVRVNIPFLYPCNLFTNLLSTFLFVNWVHFFRKKFFEFIPIFVKHNYFFFFLLLIVNLLQVLVFKIISIYLSFMIFYLFSFSFMVWSRVLISGFLSFLRTSSF